MKNVNIKDISVLILVIGLMSILGLIVYDEFAMANEHGGKLDGRSTKHLNK